MIGDYFSSLIALFLPRNCPGCGQGLSKGEKELCVQCLADLPETGFYQTTDNPIKDRFVGRFAFEQAAACYYFQKSSVIQNIIHQFKYKNKENVAFFMGQQMGRLLKDADSFEKPDVIVPVPLHPRKKKKRGYNQSELLGKGLAEEWTLPINTQLLKRKSQTQTQTKLSAVQRWENVKDAFVLSEKSYLSQNHFLLIDDVVTSGATMEACARVLSKLGDVKISMVALATAEY